MIPPERNQQPNIGLDYLTDLYRETNLETRDPQPLFILHRDTIRTFLHEKIAWFGLYAKLLGFIGVEIPILAAIFTSTFHDTGGISANLIGGVFVAFAILFGIQIVFDGIRYWNIRARASVDQLTDELGSRGSQIRPIRRGAQQPGAPEI